MTKKEFGKLLRELRIDAGYTQLKMAGILGLKSSQAIANIESGRVILPKKCYRQLIQEFKEINPKQFIDMVVDMKTREFRKDIEDHIYCRKRKSDK